MVSIKNLSKYAIFISPFLVLVFIAGVVFVGRDFWRDMFFYSRTRSVPITFGGQQTINEVLPYNAKEFISPDKFMIIVRKNDSGKYFVVWDEKRHDVWSLALFEIPSEASAASSREPLFLIRSPGRFIANPKVAIKFLRSPYVMGDIPRGFDVFPKEFLQAPNLEFQKGKKYFVQALSFTEVNDRPQDAESTFSFVAD